METHSTKHYEVVWFIFDNGYTVSFSQAKDTSWKTHFEYAIWETGSLATEFHWHGTCKHSEISSVLVYTAEL